VAFVLLVGRARFELATNGLKEVKLYFALVKPFINFKKPNSL